MEERFCRTAMLIGEAGLARLKTARVAVFGIGGVGSFAAEALARAGVGRLVLVDNDAVAASNINRQLAALCSTLGRSKAAVMKERIEDVNPAAEVEIVEEFFLPERAGLFFHGSYDYIVDAIDTVAGKVGLVMAAKERAIPIVSSMGAGNKLDPTKFEVADIYETSVCPLARVMRRELKSRGVEALKVVYSTEKPRRPLFAVQEESAGRGEQVFSKQPPGSVSFVPSVAGLILASIVVRELAGLALE
ncbi:tRNA threonylcarbamoyladenosine dehydratase [uncultured Selenomonas sp.]|uniref:tRNA threonylcarbamoyladenosine dehydratase n=1 Tax=uncultured Selenomonas sp. TaxID=159275 RepID=UPI00261FB39B|nr:tRNA threonylcarbamoyladenosine dehydratase [uncultured Selenomonas sp.]